MRHAATQTRRTTFSAALLASTILCSAAPAWAQDASGPGQTTDAAQNGPALPAAGSSDDQEIIVTATKREENLQNVPISIQAIGTQRLQELNVSNFEDYSKFTPSVSFQQTQQGGTNVYIRGVVSGGDGNHSGSLPSVGVYLDEQPVTTIGGTLDIHIYDIARIEVLRGPQGTLYGASSEAGTIRIITNKPDPSGFYGGADAEISTVRHGEQGGKVEGFFNAPLSDSAAVRVVGWYRHDAGYVDNVAGTRSFIPAGNGDQIVKNNHDLVKDDFNDADVVGGRAALGIDLNDSWTATATLMGQDTRERGSFGYEPSVGDLKVQQFYPDHTHDRFAQAALTVQGKISNWDLTYAGSYLERKINSSNDYTDYAEAYDSLYSAAGGLANYFYFSDNAGNLIDPSQHIIGRDHFTKMSHELRIASPADKPLRLIAGLFYQRQTHLIHQDYQVTGLADALSVNGFPGTLWLTQQNRIDKDYAAFGELSYDVTPQLSFTGGVRAYKYDNSLIGFFGFGRNPDGPPYNGAGSSKTGVVACFRDGSGNLLPAAVGGSPCTNLGVLNGDHVSPKGTKGDGFTYRFNATWKPTPDHMLYATWSKGFRPGGINRRGTLPPYQEDTLVNYEVGFKSSWTRTLRLNGALFWQDWKKFQFSFLGQNSFTEIHNGPDARIKGVELDLNWRPVQGLSLISSLAYTDAKTRKNLCLFDDPTYTCTQPGPGGEDNRISSPSGTRLPITPKFKISGTARYEFPLIAEKAHVQAAVTHQSSAPSDLRHSINQAGTGNDIDPAALTGPLKAYTLVDLNFGIDWRRFTAELFVDNLFDVRAQRSKVQECGQCFNRIYLVTYPPRTIGLRLGTKF